MASSGTIYSQIYGNINGEGYRMHLVWSQSNLNPETLTSTVTVVAKVVATGDGRTFYANALRNGHTIVDGAQQNWQTSNLQVSNPPNGGWEIILATKTFTVNHNVDGSKSMNISAWWEWKWTWEYPSPNVYYPEMVAGGTVTLDTIPVSKIFYRGSGGFGMIKAVYYNSSSGGWKRAKVHYRTSAGWTTVQH